MGHKTLQALSDFGFRVKVSGTSDLGESGIRFKVKITTTNDRSVEFQQGSCLTSPYGLITLLNGQKVENLSKMAYGKLEDMFERVAKQNGGRLVAVTYDKFGNRSEADLTHILKIIGEENNA
ncbi:hypothetical protein SM033_00097 [Vibrio phage vB_VpaM_sm033]|nr:hypothetical protein SM033_00097 [Vibrio phage vB_VpaM_sm033]